MTQKEQIVKMIMIRPFKKITSFDLKRWSIQIIPPINCQDKRMRELCAMSNLTDFGFPTHWIHSRRMNDREMAIYGSSVRVQMYEILSIDNPLHNVVFMGQYPIREEKIITA